MLSNEDELKIFGLTLKQVIFKYLSVFREKLNAFIKRENSFTTK